MRRALAYAGAGLAAALAITTPAVAGSRVATETILKVQPGAHATFHQGDPVKMCYGARTDVALDASVYVRIDVREALEGAKWEELGTAKLHVNNTRCFTGEVSTSGHADLLVRATTLEGEQVQWSRSRLVRLDVA